jgi:2-C-methyl-D-erythritol 2,4-cyclodiphosphate synthase
VTALRIGLGVDAHAFGEGVPLVLGGVRIEHPVGLVGHSDGDVVAHALTDALLGAAGLADIGALFPSDDERYRGADSLVLLADAYAHVRRAGFGLVNADCVLIGQEPKIAPYRDEMRRRLAQALGVEQELVNVRATTTDRLGFTGRGEGLAAQAVALLGVHPVSASFVPVGGYTRAARRAIVEGRTVPSRRKG